MLLGEPKAKCVLLHQSFIEYWLWSLLSSPSWESLAVISAETGLEFHFFLGSLPTKIYGWRGVEIIGKDKKKNLRYFTISNCIINIKHKHNIMKVLYYMNNYLAFSSQLFSANAKSATLPLARGKQMFHFSAPR